MSFLESLPPQCLKTNVASAIEAGNAGSSTEAASSTSTPFWDGYGEGQVIEEGSELEQLRQQLAKGGRASPRGSKDETEDEWDLLMQIDWLVEVEGLMSCPGNRVVVIRRPGDMRIASAISSES